MAAMENPQITAYVVDATEFPDLSAQYAVQAVPLTVIDGGESVSFAGKYPEGRFVAELQRAVQR